MRPGALAAVRALIAALHAPGTRLSAEARTALARAEDLLEPYDRRNDAEAKASRALGLPVADIRARALALWGRRFADERDARAGDARGARGQAARSMYAELRRYVP
jgi:hypothetical protein